MPPVTRAALRSNTSVLDNNNDTPTTDAAPVISEATDTRPVLGEVAGNSEFSAASNDLTAFEGPAKKATTKGTGSKKGKGNSAIRKGSTKSQTTKVTEDTGVVLLEEESERLPEEVIENSEAIDEPPEVFLGEGHQKGAVSMHDVYCLSGLNAIPTNAVSTKRIHARSRRISEYPISTRTVNRRSIESVPFQDAKI